MVTRPCSTMTGTSRFPLEYRSIRSRSALFLVTLMYVKGTFRFV